MNTSLFIPLRLSLSIYLSLAHALSVSLSISLSLPLYRHGASGRGNALRNWELRAREVRPEID